MKPIRYLLPMMFAFLALLLVSLTPGSAQAAAEHCDAGMTNQVTSPARHDMADHALTADAPEHFECCAKDNADCAHCPSLHCATTCVVLTFLEPQQLRRPQFAPLSPEFARPLLYFPTPPLSDIERPPKFV